MKYIRNLRECHTKVDEKRYDDFLYNETVDLNEPIRKMITFEKELRRNINSNCIDRNHESAATFYANNFFHISLQFSII